MANKIRVGIVGLGHWGPNFVGALASHPHAEVVCVVESSPERREFLAQRMPNIKVIPSFEQCIEARIVDAVVIATPTKTHHELACAALQAGIHVLVEKPLAYSSKDCVELISIAERKNLVLMTGHIFLYNEGILELKRIVDAGELGNVLYMRSIRTNLGPIRSDVNALWDLASHDISIFNYIYSSLPETVSCSAHHILGGGVEDIAQASLCYSGGKIASVFVSWLDPEKKRQITVVGDQRMVVFDDMKPERPLRVYDKGVRVARPLDYSDSFSTFRMSIHDGSISEPAVSTGLPLRNECEHFIDCIANGQTPLTDGHDGRRVVSVLEALSRSSELQGHPVSV